MKNNPSVVNQIETPEERLAQAKILDQEAQKGFHKLILSLSVINGKGYFIELGFSTIKDYCSKRLSISSETAFKYMQVTEKLGRYLLPENVDNPQIQPENETNFTREINDLSFYKLYQLSRLPNKQVEYLLSGSSININGAALTLDRVKEMDRTELAKIISADKKSATLKMPAPWIERRYKIKKTAEKLIKMIRKEIDDAYIQGHEEDQIDRPLKEIEIWLGNYFDSPNKPDKE
jgi:hypothetical protein